MSLTNPTYIRNYHSLPDDEPKDSFLELHIKRAKKKLIRWVGVEIYVDAESETPADQDRADDLKDAEAELVMFYGVSKLNLKISNLGLVQSSKSTDMGEGNFTIASPVQVKKLQDNYWQFAMDIVNDYMPGSSGAVAIKAE